VLDPFDDFPVHQTPLPVAHTAGADRNAYDRYFFNGYDRSGSICFGAALGLYPNRSVIDAAFSVLVDGRQRSVHASGRAPDRRDHTAVGPIRIEVLEPLRRLRVVVDAGELGMEADLTFAARTPAVEEPRFTLREGPLTVFDYTRLAQWGTWTGWLRVDGTEMPVTAGTHLGCRDRSWGVRPLGEPPGGAPPSRLPQFFWLWAPLHFDDGCTHFDVNEDAEGRRWHHSGMLVPLGDGGAASSGRAPEPMRDVDWRIDWEPGTRRARRASLRLVPWHGEPHQIDLEPLATFQMKGLGYLNPDWGHGVWKGELAVGTSEWVVAELDPVAPENLHVQQIVRARWQDRVGIGVLEQLAINDHRPSGLQGLFDGAAASGT